MHLNKFNDIFNYLQSKKVRLKNNKIEFYINGISGWKRDGIIKIKVDNTWYDIKKFNEIYEVIEE